MRVHCTLSSDIAVVGRSPHEELGGRHRVARDRAVVLRSIRSLGMAGNAWGLLHPGIRRRRVQLDAFETVSGGSGREMREQVRIDEMYAFIVVDDDGAEVIPAIGTMIDGVVTAMPMCGADMKRAEALRPQAQRLARQMKKPIFLVKFTTREYLEVIE